MFVPLASTDRMETVFIWSAAACRRLGAATCLSAIAVAAAGRGPGKRGHARALQNGHAVEPSRFEFV